jgi:hypothetical protein
MKKSPYIKHELRLQDVMAAIQVMGTYEWDSSPIDKWKERMGKPISVNGIKTWKEVFEDHPEFFYIEDWVDPTDKQSKQLASLKWRRANDKTYDPKTNLDLTPGQAAQRDRLTLSRKPLTAEQVGTLLKIAVELHTRASAFQERKDKLLTLVVTVFGALLGAFLGAILKSGAPGSGN